MYIFMKERRKSNNSDYVINVLLFKNYHDGIILKINLYFKISI